MRRRTSGRIGRGTRFMFSRSSVRESRGITFLPLSSLKVGPEVATPSEFGTEFLHVHIVAHNLCKIKTRVSIISEYHGFVEKAIPRNKESGSSTSGRQRSAQVLRGRGSCLTASMTSFSWGVSW